MRSYPEVNTTRACLREVNIGSGNGLLPDGIKPLPELLSTQLSVTIRRNLSIMSINISAYVLTCVTLYDA